MALLEAAALLVLVVVELWQLAVQAQVQEAWLGCLVMLLWSTFEIWRRCVGAWAGRSAQGQPSQCRFQLQLQLLDPLLDLLLLQQRRSRAR